MSTHRSRMKRKAFVWQVLSMAIAGAAVAAVVFPLSKMMLPGEVNWDGAGGVSTASTSNSDAAALSLVDATTLGSILEGLAPAKAVVPETKIEEEKPEVEPERADPRGNSAAATVTPTGRVNWVYLGSAVTPRASRALVRIDQSQKFIRQGMEVDGVKLVEVHDDHIMIEKGGLQERIERAVMTADAALAPPKPKVGDSAAAQAAKGGAATPPAPTPPAGAAAALAAAQAAHGKAKGGEGAGRLVARIMQLTPEQRAQTFQVMVSSTASYEERLRAISELGFDPAAPLEERREAVRALGINPDDPQVLRVLEDEMNGAARDLR